MVDFVDKSENEDVLADGAWKLYFVTLVDMGDPARDVGLVKVGITKGAVESRIANLQTGNPYRLRLEHIIQTPVARALECWVHRTHSMAHLEWLRLRLSELPALIDEVRAENERLCRIAHARAHWSSTPSNGKTRGPSSDELRLYQDARGVSEDFWSAALRWQVTRLRIYVTAGAVGRIPGVMQSSRHAPFRKFKPHLAQASFPELAAGHMCIRARGQFRWRGVPTKGSPQFASIRAEVESWNEKKKQLDQAMLCDDEAFRRDGERTDTLAELHQQYIAMSQRVARLEIDRQDVRARAVQQLEAYDEISGVCSYSRQLRSQFNGDSFRNAHRDDALKCSPIVEGFVHRRVFMSRSY